MAIAATAWGLTPTELLGTAPTTFGTVRWDPKAHGLPADLLTAISWRSEQVRRELERQRRRK